MVRWPGTEIDGPTDDQRARILASRDLAEVDRWLVQAVTAADPSELF